MSFSPNRAVLLFAILLLPRAAFAELTFEKDIRPIFRAHCFDCHGADAQDLKGELDLRLVRFAVRGGASGPAITAGAPESSYLVERIRSGEMPPGEHRVPDAEIETIERWIAAGARTARPEPESIGPGLGVTPEERRYWAFQPVRPTPLPDVQAADRVRTPIDALLLARMEPHGLTFAPDADRTTLIRRAYLDLIGLPPTPEQVQAFLDDESDQAWERLIDQLLDSPHYGERWGRHWLDVAGYADSEGYSNRDDVRAWAYKYRDWVIRAFNQDMPMDQFLTWQLAGDELVEPPYKNMTPQEIDQLTATGFLRMVADGTDSENSEKAREQVMSDLIKVVSSSLLGLSVGCAQCHDHRYDPVSQVDYYRLRAVFEPAVRGRQWRTPSARRISLYTDEDIAAAKAIEARAAAKNEEKAARQKEYMEAALQAELARLEEAIRGPLEQAYKTPGDKRTDEQKALLKQHPNIASLSPGVLYQYNQAHADALKKLDQEIAAIRAEKPKEEFLRALTEPLGEPLPETRRLHRGDFRQPQELVAPGGLTVAAPPEQPLVVADNDPKRPTSGRRLAYARWLTSGHHPLVARVLVNRFWMNHFGRGIVATPDEFGKLGTPPTHPQLLDWLAREFVAGGWSLKRFHRLMMTSTVYRQQSRRNPASDAVDAANRFYWHFPVRRLEAEVIRDSILAVSGRLEPERFGPPTPVSADDTGQIVIEGDQQRRSIYLQARRTQPVAILTSFDAPVMEVNCAKRESSTVATQSLMLMNSKFILAFSQAFARRVAQEAEGRADPALTTGLEMDTSFVETARNPWSYGYGAGPAAGGAAEGEVLSVRFTPYPFFGNGTWKGGEKVPDDQIGYSFLNAAGGHPENASTETIRRWTSPVGGTIFVKGTLGHSSNNGDGVRLTLHSSRLGSQGRWEVKAGKVEYSARFEVEVGDHVDTIVDEREGNSSDSFSNAFTITLLADGKEKRTWDSVKQFRGPAPARPPAAPATEQLAYAWQLAYGRPPSRTELEMSVAFLQRQLELLDAHDTPLLQAMTNFGQTLFSSNEFLYLH